MGLPVRQSPGSDRPSSEAPNTARFNQTNGHWEVWNGSSWEEYGGVTVPDAEAIADAAVATHVGLADPHSQYQKESEKDASNGYAGLDSNSRTTKGVFATDDLIVDSTARGLVLKDTQSPAHYWRVTINSSGPSLVLTDLGTTPP
jgi:hypothetical protein